MMQADVQMSALAWRPWSPSRRRVATLLGPERRRYDLMLSTPSGDAPSGGWPCLIVLDGDRFFDAFSGAADALGQRSEKTGVVPTMIAALSYRGDFKDQRTRDFTTSADPERGAAIPFGGADAFRQFLLNDVVTALSREGANGDRMSLFGHSLAGLFVLEMLAVRPTAFAGWISVSPSLWWRSPDPVVGGAALLVGWGEGENARSMSSRIAAWVDAVDPDHRPIVRIAPGADHGSAPFALIPDILRHAGT